MSVQSNLIDLFKAGWASLVYAAGLITLRSFVQIEPPLPFLRILILRRNK